jgi:hypothetical protein
MSDCSNDNDNSDGTLTNKEHLEAIISTFPQIEYAFGYGSGVFSQQQQQNHDKEAMIDLILSIPDDTCNNGDNSTATNVYNWHEQNIQMNPDHYAFIPKLLGPNFITMLQHTGAGCYFNPMVKIRTEKSHSNMSNMSRLVKYGVISHSKLKQDLMEWDCMYIAGRMHKPILALNESSSSSSSQEINNGNNRMQSDEIMYLQEHYNLKYAFASALLLLPLHNNNNNATDDDDRRIKINNLFEIIAGLSYIGDPRLAAGAEDPGKVSKLVNSNGQLERFKSLYQYQISNLEQQGVISTGTGIGTGTGKDTDTGCHDSNSQPKSIGDNNKEVFIEVDVHDWAVRRKLLSDLPKNIQYQMMKHHKYQYQYQHNLAQQHSSPSTNIANLNTNATQEEITLFAKDLTNTIGQIVGRPARIQSAKGLLTAGVHKSIQYVWAKLAKGALRNVRLK